MSRVIEIKQLLFRWQCEAQPVLNIDSLVIEAGQRVFIKGPSGSGKSTLLSLLGGVLIPERGEINLLEQRINTLPAGKRDHFRANHIGFIFQMFNLIPYLSVLENVLLPLQFSPPRRARVLHSGTAEDEARRLLSHLDLHEEHVHQSVTALSVGQQQRVAAARALIGRPEIIIADEPTSSLDADRRNAFIELLIRECDTAGNTLLFVSHDSSLERFFDQRIDLREINRAVDNRTEAA